MSASKTQEPEEEKAALGAFGECPLPIFEHPQIVMGHGSGGKLSAELIEKVFVSQFRNATLERMDDQAALEINGTRLAFTTDSFVVTPIFFPGGDIGSLAVNGTVNDLAMGGAKPLYLSAAFILEEGLPAEELRRVVESMRVAADAAGVQIVTGDTKVVNRGKGDKLFINTTGIGVVEDGVQLSADRARPGDKILLSGYIGDHGITILSQRENLEFESVLQSDCAGLWGLVRTMMDAAGENLAGLRCMRDPTRGGVATTLNEIAGRSRMGMLLQEDKIPVRDTVRGACELLGLDPLHIANEGQFLAVVSPEYADAAINALSLAPGGSEAQVIGEVREQPAGTVLVTTLYGGSRIVDMLVGDPLPRIC